MMTVVLPVAGRVVCTTLIFVSVLSSYACLYNPPKLIQTSVIHCFSFLTYVGLRIRSPDLNPFLQVEFKKIVSAVTNKKQGCTYYSPCNWQYNAYHKTITSNFYDIPNLLVI